jgi:hypothetical protein
MGSVVGTCIDRSPRRHHRWSGWWLHWTSNTKEPRVIKPVASNIFALALRLSNLKLNVIGSHAASSVKLKHHRYNRPSRHGLWLARLKAAQKDVKHLDLPATKLHHPMQLGLGGLRRHSRFLDPHTFRLHRSVPKVQRQTD